MHHFVLKVISLFFVCIHIGTAIDVGKLSLVNEGQAKLEVCLSKDAATHTCSVVVGCELLNFKMDALNKPYGRSFSTSWIGIIDYSSGAFRLYPRGQIQGLCKANIESLKGYKAQYNRLHPSCPKGLNDKDLMILPWLMNFQSFSSSVFYGSLQKALWLSCQSSPEIPDQR